MSADYLRQQEEDAARRRAVQVERQHDYFIRWQRLMLEQGQRNQVRRQAAEDARRQRAEFERRRPVS